MEKPTSTAAPVDRLVSRLRQSAYQEHIDGNLQDEAADTIEDLNKQVRILSLATDIEDDLQDRIAEMHKYIAMEQGYTMAGIARLLRDCQRRMAADWVEVGRHRMKRG
jgi:hypothetical protein